ncbi:MAG: hypothetical protein QM756_03155 [Polyangiaceae bacterium]
MVEEQPAGRDSDKRALSVVSISLGKKSPEPEAAEAFGNCEPIEYWMVARSKLGIVETELLRELCNDGYGASGVGEDTIEVKPNQFSHQQYGGSAWRWSETQVLQLVPRRIIELGEFSNWNLGPNRTSSSWNWESFSGSAGAFTPLCGPDEQPLPDEDADAIEGKTFNWVLIPVVDVDTAYSTDGWKQVALGACAASVGGAPPQYLIHGERDGDADSRFSVVGLNDGSFVVEIHDDHWVLSAKRQLFEDHLELWLGDEGGAGAGAGAHCDAKPTKKPEQWGISLRDGSVFSGYGAPAAERLQAELGPRDQGSVRLRVRPRDPVKGITFVYSDSDDGLKQKALLASSGLLFGNVRTLGATVRIVPSNATCGVREGRLEPILK